MTTPQTQKGLKPIQIFSLQFQPRTWASHFVAATICTLLLGCFAPLILTAQTVNIPDPGLQGAIRTALNKPSGVITVTDMESLATLDASLGTRGLDSPVIQTLEGLPSGTLRALWFLPLEQTVRLRLSLPSLERSVDCALELLPTDLRSTRRRPWLGSPLLPRAGSGTAIFLQAPHHDPIQD